MTSLNRLKMSSQSPSSKDMELLDLISPVSSRSQSGIFSPIIAAIVVSLIVLGLTSKYFTRYFEKIPYLPFVQSGIVFSVSMLMILFFT